MGLVTGDLPGRERQRRRRASTRWRRQDRGAAERGEGADLRAGPRRSWSTRNVRDGRLKIHHRFGGGDCRRRDRLHRGRHPPGGRRRRRPAAESSSRRPPDRQELLNAARRSVVDQEHGPGGDQRRAGQADGRGRRRSPSTSPATPNSSRKGPRSRTSTSPTGSSSAVRRREVAEPGSTPSTARSSAPTARSW